MASSGAREKDAPRCGRGRAGAVLGVRGEGVCLGELGEGGCNGEQALLGGCNGEEAVQGKATVLAVARAMGKGCAPRERACFRRRVGLG